jgi:hypothetical protein
MNELTKIWFTELLENEIKETNVNISNNALWADGSATMEEASLFKTNIRSLEEYKQFLLDMKDQVEREGKINV